MSTSLESDAIRRRQEEVIEPALPIVDPGHHLYDRPSRCYLFPEFLEDLASGHNVVATVAIEDLSMFRASGPPEFRPVGETEFYNGIAAMSASGCYGPTRVCAGIVGYADLRLGALVEKVIEAHIIAGGGRFRGIRMSAALPLSSYPTSALEQTGLPSDPIRAEGRILPGMLREPSLREGLACITRMGLSFDIHVTHPQLKDLVDLACAVPAATIILNHCGQPLGIGPFAGRQKEVFREWTANINTLAACPNVFVKLGGLRRSGAPISHSDGWQPGSMDFGNAWRPYFDTCIEAFGPYRCMFESNFPADKAVCEYGVIWNAFKHFATNYSDAEKAALFSQTAARVYRLPDLVAPKLID